jgi:hypothetical protein
MKTIRPKLKHSVLATCAALFLAAPASLTFAQTADLTVNTFDDAYSIYACDVEWGTGSVTWDGTQDSTGNGGGSCLVTVDFSNSEDTPAADYFCIGWGNPWYFPTTIDASQYKSVDFDIMYDNTSDIDIPHFNDLSTWDTTMTNKNGSNVMQSWAGSGYLSGSLPGIDIEFCGRYNMMAPSLATTNIPAAAAGGWTHISIPINPAQANIGSVNGIVFHKWINQQWGIANDAQARFWVDNIVFKGNPLPLPPPTVSAPTTKATLGLNVFASTDNQLYDRQLVVLRQTNGLSWVGHATPSLPVSYSFTIVGYPNSTNCEAWMFLCPNPAYTDNAPDWNETNCAIVYLQKNAAGATGHFQYKVGEPMGQNMYSGAGIYTAAPGTGGGTLPESGNLATVNATTGVYGTWTLKFTSDTAGQLIAPDGSATSFTFPAYNAPKFAESNPVGFNIYLGMQANKADSLNQAVVYSNFAVSNTAAPFKENFLADTVLDTTNVWNTSAASGPAGVLIVPAADSTALWLQWTLPASGLSLETSPVLNGGSLAWTLPTNGPVIGMAGVGQQLVNPGELPIGNAAFFRLIKPTFTKLQILLPGETAAPNTPTGKTGTPGSQEVDSCGDYSFNVIVNAVDDNWNVINSATDTIQLTSSSEDFLDWYDGVNLVNGTATFSVTFLTDSPGSATITATDSSNGTKTADTSAPVSYYCLVPCYY